MVRYRKDMINISRVSHNCAIARRVHDLDGGPNPESAGVQLDCELLAKRASDTVY